MALSLSTELNNATTLGGSQEGGFENEVQTFHRAAYYLHHHGKGYKL